MTLYETESGLFERSPSISFTNSDHDFDTNPKNSGVCPEELSSLHKRCQAYAHRFDFRGCDRRLLDEKPLDSLKSDTGQ